MYSCHSAKRGDGVKVKRSDLRGLSPAWVLCAAQVITSALAFVVAWMASGSAAAIAALFGGIVVVVPALYFAFRVDRRRGKTQANEILGAFYRAELGKLLLTALLFFVGARIFGDHFAPLMLTSVACLAMNWLVLAFVAND
jgi:ATP synthase protein I